MSDARFDWDAMLEAQRNMTALALPSAYDNRHSYNPPAVERPAMDDKQFWFDEQREIEANLLANPIVMAHTVAELKLRVAALEREIENGNGTD